LLAILATLSLRAFGATPEGIWAARSPNFGEKLIGKVKITIIQGNLVGELIEIYPMSKDAKRFCWRNKKIETGPVMMCDYHLSNGKWVGGKIYESSTGKVYPSEIKVSPEGKRLYVKGTSGPFSETVVWDRLDW
ncbi:MAG: DUF2147 domain-containing protein, partial [Candidatus Berkiella sp.]